MEARLAVALIVTAVAVVLVYRNVDAIIDAIRRFPWDGGGPGPTGPAVAADPFVHRVVRELREPMNHYFG